MESRTWFFSFTVLKKNITRFAPVWIVYSALLLLPKLSNLGLGLLIQDNVMAATMTLEFLTVAISNFFYAMVCAMLLFGDLFRGRMCNALYALPIRREGWFFTNVVTGLLFSFVPNLVLTLLMLLAFGSAWQVPLLWLAVASLQFLFFFSIAVLAVYCTGKRFAMALAYILINLFSMLIYWLISSIYEPLLYGVVISADLFMLLCPLAMLTGFDYVSFKSWHFSEQGSIDWAIGGGWGYLAVCAILALAIFGLALLCCRRRNLEAAGDFIAFRCLKPVILVLYTLLVGMVLNSFAVPAFLAFAVGFFTGLMLLERSVRVFRKKTFLGAGILLGVYVISLLVVLFDIFGIVRWVPQVQDVKSVQMECDGVILTMETPEEINDVLTIHRQALEGRNKADNYTLSGYAVEYSFIYEDRHAVRFSYTTQTGGTKTRLYYIDKDSEAGALLHYYKNTPEAVLGEVYTTGVHIFSVLVREPHYSVQNPVAIDALLNAIVADCQAQRLNQDRHYTEDILYTEIELLYDTANGEVDYIVVRIYEDCENVITWMNAHNIYPFHE